MSAPRLGNGKKPGKKAARSTPKTRGRTNGKTEHLAARLGLALREHHAAVEQQAATAEILRALSRSTTDAQPVFDAIVKNVRLFNETREALEHQKASADILRIVASSVESTAPVFEAITAAGMRLMPGIRVALILIRDGELHYASHSGVSAERRAEMAKFFPMRLDRNSIVGTAILDKRMTHVADIDEESARYKGSPRTARASGWRAMLAAPLLQDGQAIGALAITRPEPGPFTEPQIALAQTFADQAVI